MRFKDGGDMRIKDVVEVRSLGGVRDLRVTKGRVVVYESGLRFLYVANCSSWNRPPQSR